MRALVLHAARDARIVDDHPDPVCPPDGVVVEVEACGLCRSDHHVWSGGWAWENAVPAVPVVLGHEVAGRVVELGTRLDAPDWLAVGVRVAVPFQLACGRCAACLVGATNRCRDALYTGNGIDGGFADLMAVPRAANLVRVPDRISATAAAAVGCRYMTAWRAVAVAGAVVPGEWVAVYGCGGLGLSCVQIAAALGAQVVAVDPSPAARDAAAALGVAHTCDTTDAPARITDLTGGGAALTVDAVGRADAAVDAVRSLRPGGRHVQVGLTDDVGRGRIAWPADRIVFYELQLIGSLGNAIPDYGRLMALVDDGTLEPDLLVGPELTLDAAADLMPRFDQAGLSGLRAVAMNRSDDTTSESE